jgi:TonB family protein
MNTSLTCIAVTLICTVSSSVVHAEAPVTVAPSAAALPSVASAAVARLSAASIQALPGFPIEAYRKGYREGRVELRYTVNENGSVEAVEVLKATGAHPFRRTATNAVEAWRFAPTGASERRTVEFRFGISDSE